MSRMLSPSKLSVLVECPRSQKPPAASFIYRPYLEFFNYRGVGGYSAAPGIRTLNPVKGDGFQDRFLTNSDGQHIADTPPLEPLQGIYPSVLLEIILSDCSVAASFYIYNGAETITISVSLTFHLS